MSADGFGVYDADSLKPAPELAKELTANFRELCKQAASAIKQADVMLFATGAGWSADSGLAVYQDIACVEEYQRLGLEYHDLCDPSCLSENAELFYGFWGKCFNDYRDTPPHEGYQIIKSWRDRFFSPSSHFGRLLQQMICQFRGHPNGPITSKVAKEEKDGLPGPFFCYTSNVDAHFSAAGYRACGRSYVCFFVHK
mmetsp:Transcript_43170/g.84623  ORF Transcript_43170/g.84623 Transcript_43170/m.84623 type:complete len:197 (+) Transcript_43170:15-605(+)